MPVWKDNIIKNNIFLPGLRVFETDVCYSIMKEKIIGILLAMALAYLILKIN